MKQLFKLLTMSTLAIFLIGCGGNTEETDSTEMNTEPNIDYCEYEFHDTYGEEIILSEIHIPYSHVLSNTYNFMSPCKEENESPLILADSSTRTHQVIFTFDAIYPVEYMDLINYEGTEATPLESITIETSMDGINFDRIYYDYKINSTENRIEMGNKLMKSIKIITDDSAQSVGIQDLSLKLGEGIIIREETALSELFHRTSDWTGADGIFTFDLDQGGDSIGTDHSTTGFIFSDTFIGGVGENNLRTNFEMINNTFGYMDMSNENMTFVWDDSGEKPQSVLLPDAYTGQRARNLLDGDGLTITNSPNALLTNQTEGTMWLSEDLNSELVIDLGSEYALTSIYIWNYNGMVDYGVKAFDLFSSLDNETYDLLGSYTIDQATGSEMEAYTLEITYNEHRTRYLKIVVTDTYSDEFVGLGKIMLQGVNGQYLFGQIEATSEVSDLTLNEESARLWLQDGIVINQKLYTFPILVKDYLTFFKVHNVGLIEMDIVNKQFDYQNANFYSTPLMTTLEDGGVIYFGAGILDHRDIDGYIYIYGYKDLNGRKLVVSRVTEDNFLNFNEWTYYDGTTWNKDITTCQTLISGVSAELSVTYMEDGPFAGKYMLVVMENTNSGRVVYALSDTPYGPFSDYTLIYNSTERNYLTGAFSYNAKLHPNLSTYDKLIISYNVNTTNLGALRDARIYYPRFISITEVKKDEE